MSAYVRDRFGRWWDLPLDELCPVCHQPDSCGDCNHRRLTNEDVVELGGLLKRPKGVVRRIVYVEGED